VGGDQREIRLFLVCCHTGLQEEDVIIRRHDTTGESGGAVCISEDCDKHMQHISQ
jgi:hypothetical protein